MEKHSSIGRNIERLRKLKGMKQEVLAKKIGVSHQTISRLEQSDIIDEDKLQLIADALEIPVDSIINFDGDTTLEYVVNTFHDGNHSINYNFNPMEKIVELYERMLALEHEKNELLQKLLNQKQAS